MVAHQNNLLVKSGEVRWRFERNFTSVFASWRHVSSGKGQKGQVRHKGHCYTSQLKDVFRLEEDVSRGVGQNSQGRTNLANSPGKQQLELSTCT